MKKSALYFIITSLFSAFGFQAVNIFQQLSQTQKDVAAFGPGQSYLVNSTTGSEWLLRAVSKKERERWARGYFKSNDSARKKVYQELDVLAGLAARQLPGYKPSPQNFSFRNKADEALMRSALVNMATLEIHEIGLSNNTWQVTKNDEDIPLSRYKQGYLWVRDTQDDHPYCHLYQINIIQDYEDDGRYSASYTRFVNDALFGCP
jgi:hypothetical protein